MLVFTERLKGGVYQMMCRFPFLFLVLLRSSLVGLNDSLCLNLLASSASWYGLDAASKSLFDDDMLDSLLLMDIGICFKVHLGWLDSLCT